MNLKQEAKFLSILEIPDVTLSQIDGSNQLKQLKQGKLVLGELGGSTSLIIIEDFRFAIFCQLAIYVSEFESFRAYVFVYDGKNYAINISKSHIELIALFEQSLVEICTLLYNSTHMLQGANVAEQGKNTKPNMVGNIIKQGGSIIQQGISFGASTATKGIVGVSNFLKPKSESQKKNIKISEGTKDKIKMVQNTTGNMVAFTHQAAKALVEFQISLGKSAANAIMKDKNGSENKPLNPKLQYLKDIGQQSIVSIVGIITAMEEAVEAVGKVFGENAKEVIQERYGDDAADIAEYSAGSVGNMYGAYKDVKGAGYKAVAKKQGKITAKEIGKKI